MCISFVNGIYHTKEDCQRIKRILSEKFNRRVLPFYNPTSGSWAADLTQAGIAIVNKPNNLEIARNLSIHLRSLLHAVGPNGRVLHLAHSGGAILTYLAAKYHLSVEETERIDVVCFGGGYSITHKYFHGRLINYYAKNDPLLLVDRRAGKLSKEYPKYGEFSISDPKHNTTFVFLEGIMKNPIMDHSMEGPTYLQIVEREAFELGRREAARVEVERKNTDIVRLLRKKAAHFTSIHHFWESLWSFHVKFKTPQITDLWWNSSRIIFRWPSIFAKTGREETGTVADISIDGQVERVEASPYAVHEEANVNLPNGVNQALLNPPCADVTSPLLWTSTTQPIASTPPKSIATANEYSSKGCANIIPAAPQLSTGST